QHPLRDGLAERAGDYPWSSAAHHLGLRRDALISEHPAFWALGNTPFEREALHRQALVATLTPLELQRIRHAVHGGWPLLTEAGLAALAPTLDRPLRPRSPGRPATRINYVPNKHEV
ncbi:MAG: hypothetical protein ACK4F7_10965, partial [Inhella sp.]